MQNEILESEKSETYSLQPNEEARKNRRDAWPASQTHIRFTNTTQELQPFLQSFEAHGMRGFEENVISFERIFLEVDL